MTTGNYTVGGAMTTGLITIGGTAGTGAITLGSSSAAQTLNLGTGAGVSTVNIGTGAAANVITIGSPASTLILSGVVASSRGAISSLGTVQNSTPTAAQLLTGVVTQTGVTGAGTVTLPIGSLLSTAVPGATAGTQFRVMFANLGGAQTLTITGATGTTVIGTATVASGTDIEMLFVNTGANTWNVYTNK